MSASNEPEGGGSLSQSRLRGELKDELGQWMQRQFRLIGIIAVVAGVVGVPALVSWTVGGLVEKELSHREADWDRLTKRMEASSDAAATAAAEATQIANNAKAQIARMQQDVNDALAAARKAVDSSVADARAASDLARKAADEAAAAMTTAREVQSQLAGAGATSGALTEKDRAAVRIMQEVERVEPADAQGHTWRTIAFSVDVDSAIAETPVDQIIGRIQRVEYVFDAAYFARPVQTVTNRENRFRHTVRVFGITKVSALIYLAQPDEVVERRGMMDIFARQPTPLE